LVTAYGLAVLLVRPPQIWVVLHPVLGNVGNVTVTVHEVVGFVPVLVTVT
jgi:hypothetical protein